MQTVDIAIAQAFTGRVPDVEKSPATLIGFAGTESHACLPKLINQYLFNKDRFLLLSYAWVREWSREETAPRRGIWYGGPKGAGKTTVVEQFFARLGVPVLAITCNRRVPLSDYISKMVPDGEGGWIDTPGPLMIAMQEGYPVILNEPSAMDEADLIAMHDIIDRGLLVTDGGKVVHAARGFMVFASDNTMGYGDDTGAYGGTGPMNGATMRRFLKDEVDYPAEAEEIQILRGYFPNTPEDVLKGFVTFANLMREPYRRNQSQVTMGTGELKDWVECAAYFNGLSAQRRSPAWFAFKRIMGGIPPVAMETARSNFLAAFNYDVSAE